MTMMKEQFVLSEYPPYQTQNMDVSNAKSNYKWLIYWTISRRSKGKSGSLITAKHALNKGEMFLLYLEILEIKFGRDKYINSARGKACPISADISEGTFIV